MKTKTSRPLLFASIVSIIAAAQANYSPQIVGNNGFDPNYQPNMMVNPNSQTGVNPENYNSSYPNTTSNTTSNAITNTNTNGNANVNVNGYSGTYYPTPEMNPSTTLSNPYGAASINTNPSISLTNNPDTVSMTTNPNSYQNNYNPNSTTPGAPPDNNIYSSSNGPYSSTANSYYPGSQPIASPSSTTATNEMKPKSLIGKLSSTLSRGATNFGNEIVSEVAPVYKEVLKAELRGRAYDPYGYHNYNRNSYGYGGGYNYSNNAANYGSGYNTDYNTPSSSTYQPPTNPPIDTNYNQGTINDGSNVYSSAASSQDLSVVHGSSDCSCPLNHPTPATQVAPTTAKSKDWGIFSLFSSTPKKDTADQFASTSTPPQTSNTSENTVVTAPNLTDQLVNRRGPFSYPQLFLENFDEKPLPPPKTSSIGLSL